MNAPVTKTSSAITLALAAVISCTSCKHVKPVSADTKPEGAHLVNGVKLEFPENHPQLVGIQTSAAIAVKDEKDAFTGRLVWDENVTNRVFSPLKGQVEKVVGEVGKKVAKGDVLAVLRSADLGQAQADYRKAEHDLIQATKVNERQKALLAHGAAAAKDAEAAQSDYNRALNEMNRTKKRLEMLGRTDGDFTDLFSVTSPTAGTIVDKKINIGQQIRDDIILAGSSDLTAPLFMVTDPTHLWLQLDVPENALSRLRPGQLITLRTPAYPDREFHGKLLIVGASLDPLTRVARTRATVENPEGLLKAEMYVDATIERPAAQTQLSAVEINSRAVMYQEGQHFVFIKDSPTIFSRHEVQVERENGATMIVTSNDVKPGREVVIERNLLLNETLNDAAAAADSSASLTLADKR